MIFSRVFAGLMSLLIVACATTPEKRFSGVGPPPSGMARVYVVSPDTRCWNWSFPGTTLLINKRATVHLYENTYTQFDLRPGLYSFSTSTDRQSSCHDWVGTDFDPLNLNLRVGEIYFVKWGSAIPVLPMCAGTCSRILISIDRRTAEIQMRDTEYVQGK